MHRILEAPVAAAHEDVLRGAGRRARGCARRYRGPSASPSGRSMRHGNERIFGQPEPALQVELAGPLAVEIVRRKLGGDSGVSGGIPDALVDAVEHAGETVAHPLKDVVQPESARRRAQLLGVAGAHRRCHVGVGQATLEVVGLAIPLELVRREEVPRQADLRHDVGAEVSLVAGVVHRHHDRDAIVPWVPAEPGAEIDGGECGVPVVSMQQHRAGGDARQRRDRCRGKCGEAQEVVGIVRTLLAVQPVTVEESVVLEEAGRRLRGGVQFAPETERLGLCAELDGERIAGRLEAPSVLRARPGRAARRHRLEPMPVLVAMQAPRRFGEPAGARIGEVLRREVHDGWRLVRDRRKRELPCRAHDVIRVVDRPQRDRREGSVHSTGPRNPASSVAR